MVNESNETVKPKSLFDCFLLCNEWRSREWWFQREIKPKRVAVYRAVQEARLFAD
jgi:hypothetical protein